MSRPAFLADNDLNEQIVDGLLRRKPEIEISRAREQDLRESTDDFVLEFAAGRGLLVVSHDINTMPARAFERIETGRKMPGLIMVRQTLPVALVIENLLLIWSATEAEEWQGQVWFLPV